MRRAKVSGLALSAVLAVLAVVIGSEQPAWAQQASAQQTQAQQASGGESVRPLSEHDALGARNSRRSARSSRSRRTTRSRRATRSGRTSRSREVTATVDVAAGPSFFTFGNPLQEQGKLLSGPVYEDQPLHYGLRFDAAAIIDYEFYRKNRRLVPRQYRKMFKPGTEIRYAPAAVALIPRNLYLSPKTNNTGVYGATWELLHVGVTLLKNSSTRLSAGAGVLATYAYIDSDAFESTHFLRPGASVGLELGTMFSDTIGMSVGWDSNFYLPQDIGGGILEGSSDDALWHIGEGFLMLHYRFPFTTRI